MGREVLSYFQKDALTLKVILGLPGAGKTNFIQHLFGNLPGNEGGEFFGSAHPNTQIICFDSLRLAFGHVFHLPLEPVVHSTAGTIARMAFVEKRHVLIDESVTTYALADQLASCARAFNAEIIMYVMQTSESVCRARRVPYGFPVADFDRKVREWSNHGKAILSLADKITYVPENWQEQHAENTA